MLYNYSPVNYISSYGKNLKINDLWRKQIKKYIDRLYPICRSILGKGLEKVWK